jgi:RNA polymerase sigma-70 factor (ECF subfamily)
MYATLQAAVGSERTALQLIGACRVMGGNEPTKVQKQSQDLGRSSEFTTFMRAYQDMVFSTAARLTADDAQAEDIAQEVFLRAYQHFEQLRSSPAAGGWLKTVATNLTLNHLGRYRRRWRLFSELPGAAVDEDSSAPDIDVPGPDALLANLGLEERRAVIDEALRRLPEAQRVPLVLYHFEELSYEEIAARLKVSLSKVKTDIRRGRLSLLPLLQSGGISRDSLHD